MIKHFISKHCSPSDFVLILGFGSGSEIVGALQSNMNVVGVEKDPRQFNALKARLVSGRRRTKRPPLLSRRVILSSPVRSLLPLPMLAILLLHLPMFLLTRIQKVPLLLQFLIPKSLLFLLGLRIKALPLLLPPSPRSLHLLLMYHPRVPHVKSWSMLLITTGALCQAILPTWLAPFYARS